MLEIKICKIHVGQGAKIIKIAGQSTILQNQGQLASMRSYSHMLF